MFGKMFYRAFITYYALARVRKSEPYVLFLLVLNVCILNMTGCSTFKLKIQDDREEYRIMKVPSLVSQLVLNFASRLSLRYAVAAERISDQ